MGSGIVEAKVLRRRLNAWSVSSRTRSEERNFSFKTAECDESPATRGKEFFNKPRLVATGTALRTVIHYAERSPGRGSFSTAMRVVSC
jgi:hypothetical protein